MPFVKLNKNSIQFASVLSDFYDNDNLFSNRFFEKEFERFLPEVNIRENNNKFNSNFANPVFNKNDFKINVEENMLTISAEKDEEKNKKKVRFTRKEFSYNSFSRSFTLPLKIHTDKIDAKYNDGILKLNISKKEETKTLPKKDKKVS